MNELGPSMPPSLVANLTHWFVVVGLGTLMGLGLGQLIDTILWEISYDYVHPADYAHASGIRLGFWLGTGVAAASVIGTHPLPRTTWMAKATVIALLGVCGITLAFAVVGWSTAKLGLRESGAVSLSRAAFCTELVRGSLVGAVSVAILWTIAVWRHRRALANIISNRNIVLHTP